MILHLACFDFVDGTTADDVASLEAALREMAGTLPQLRFYRCGQNLRLRPGGADFGVVAIVDDAEGLAAYLDGDAHRAVQERLLARMTAGRHAVQLVLDRADVPLDVFG